MRRKTFSGVLLSVSSEEFDKAVIAQGLHLYPFRTESLNLAAPMVLRKRESRTPPPYMREEVTTSCCFLSFLFLNHSNQSASEFHLLSDSIDASNRFVRPTVRNPLMLVTAWSHSAQTTARTESFGVIARGRRLARILLELLHAVNGSAGIYWSHCS